MRGALCAAGAVLALVLVPGSASGFGTTPVPFSQTPVHWKITRAALECAATPGPGLADEPGRCIEPKTMALLSGEGAKTEFGAVEAPDIDGFFEDLPHCTNGDHLPVKGYPQTKAAAQRMLRSCRRHLVQRFESALHAAQGLVDAQGRIAPPMVRTAGTSRSKRCQFVDGEVGGDRLRRFVDDTKYRLAPGAKVAASAIGALLAFGGNPRAESAKCQVLWHLGAVLHGVQDSYAHGNWTDHPQRGQGGVDDPPGLGHRDLNPFMKMVGGTASPPQGWLTTCYSLLGECEGRVDHGAFAKDNGAVALRSQPVGRSYLTFGAAKEPRGKVAPGFQDSNFKLAAEAAVRASRDVWRAFGEELLRRFPGPRGQPRGRQMLCAITHDDPEGDCFGLTLSASGRHVPGTGTTLAVCSPAPVGAQVEGTMSPAGGLASGPARQATVARVGQRFPNSPGTAVGFQLEWGLRPDAVPGLYEVAVTARVGKHEVSSTTRVRVPAPGPEPYPTEWPYPGVITGRCISYR
jgi:hypothetical protein